MLEIFQPTYKQMTEQNRIQSIQDTNALEINLNVYKADLSDKQQEYADLKKEYNNLSFFAKRGSKGKEIKMRIDNAERSIADYQSKVDQTTIAYDSKRKERDRLLQANVTYNSEEELAIKLKKLVTVDDKGVVTVNGDKSAKLPFFVDRPMDDMSIDKLAMVHCTKYFPVNNTIRSSKDANVVNHKAVGGGVDKQVPVYSHRNTVHFALNGPVGDHAMGSWKDCPYVIIEPAKHHIDQLRTIAGPDSYTRGSVALSDEAVIMCSEDAYATLTDSDKKYYGDRLIKYSGDRNMAVNTVLKLSGYEPQKIGTHAWENENNDIKLFNYVKSSYPDKIPEAHVFSEDTKIDVSLTARDVVLSERVFDGRLVDTRQGMHVGSSHALGVLVDRAKNNVQYDRAGFFYKDTVETLVRGFGLNPTKDGGFELLSDDKIEESFHIPMSQRDKVVLDKVSDLVKYFENTSTKDMSQDNQMVKD